MKTNTFYEKKNYNTKDDSYKYIRVDEVLDNWVYYTYFTENWVEGSKNFYRIDETEYIELPKTLQTLCTGDILIDDDDEYRKVLGVINQNCYAMSLHDKDVNGEDLEITSDRVWTVKDLEDSNYKPYPTQPTDDTIEIEGKKYSVKEIKEKLK